MWYPISSPIGRQQPPLRYPLSLLPQPNRARLTIVTSAHHEEMGEYPASSASSLGSTYQDLAADANMRLSTRIMRTSPYLGIGTIRTGLYLGISTTSVCRS